MRFDFTDEQRAFQESLRAFLEKECPPTHLRAAWDDPTGRSPALWAKLAGMGVLGLLVPERHGGLGMDEIDLVLPLEETGRVALPEPVVETAAVGVPLLVALGGALADQWLGKVAGGEARLTVGHPIDPCVADAHVADLLLLVREDELHAVTRDAVTLEAQPCTDPLRRLFTVDWRPTAATRVARGTACTALLEAALDRGALAAAAQLVGLGQQLLDTAAAYAKTREQFGRPIGSFQAVKHALANVQVRLEFARPVIQRAAFAVARDGAGRAAAVSHAKAAAGEAARHAARTALQVHGAIGYTWEVDLHAWMKRAWALDGAWGSSLWHRRRLGAAVLDGVGTAPSFGYSGKDAHA